MKFILPIILLSLLTACGQSAEEKQKQKDQESKDRLIYGSKEKADKARAEQAEKLQHKQN